MNDFRVKILCGVLMLSLLGLIFAQFKLNSQLSDELSATKNELKLLQENVKANIQQQNQITERIDALKVKQYHSTVKLDKKLGDIKVMPKEGKGEQYMAEVNRLLECIERNSLGEDCE